MPDRSLQPCACGVVPDVDPDELRQAGEEQAVGAALATEEAANEPRDFAALAEAHHAAASLQDVCEAGGAVDEGPRRSVRYRVGIAMGQDGEVARTKRYLAPVAEARDCPALRDEVVVHQTLGARRQHMLDLGNRRHRKTP